MGTRNGSVKNGIDVLEAYGFDVLKVAATSTTRDASLPENSGQQVNGQSQNPHHRH